MILNCQDQLTQLCTRLRPPTGQHTTAGAGVRWSTGLSDEAALDVATKRYGTKFTRVYFFGDLSTYESDHSGADMALVGWLAYACGPSPEQIDRLFRQSKLYRAKWDEARGGSTYGADTIARVLKTREPDAYYGAKDGHQPITLLKVDDVIGREPPVMVIDGMIEAGTVNILSGRSSDYKSFITQHGAFSVALGEPFFGRATLQGAVLCIIAEGIGGIGKRLRAWEQHHKHDLRTAPIHFIERPLSFHDPTIVEQLTAILAEQGQPYRLIIIDTLSRNSVGADENSNSEMVKVINNMQELASATGAAVLMVHHVTKATGGMRGASAVLNSVDASFKTERDDSGHVQITTDKQKDHDDSGLITLERKLITLPDGQTSLVLERVEDHLFQPPQQRGGQRGTQAPKPYTQALGVLRLLCQQSPDGVTRQEWLEACHKAYDAKRGTFDHHRKDLIDDQLVEHDKAQGLYRPLATKFEGMMD